MRLSEFKGDKAYDVLAELIEPVMTILADPAIQEMQKSGVPKIKMIKPMIKNHKKEITFILATLDDVPVEEYQVSLLTLPLKLMELMNDPEVEQLFHSAQ